MSERQEKRRRFNLRYEYIMAVANWIDREPPWWAVFRRKKWKREKPKKPY